jgi:hypothetical protein
MLRAVSYSNVAVMSGNTVRNHFPEVFSVPPLHFLKCLQGIQNETGGRLLAKQRFTDDVVRARALYAMC